MPILSTDSRPRVSVVMCTRNRHASIGQAVRSVMANTYADFTLTVVDQSTTDETGSVLRPIAADDPRLHYMHVTEPGLSRAYNTGIRSSDGQILAFTDDDCVVPENWIDTIVAAFSAEPDGDLLYGQVLPFSVGTREYEHTPLLKIETAQRLSKSDGFKVFGMGANFAARRRLFDSVGYFDEVLGGGGPLRSSQDYDLAYRVYKSGSVVLLRPEVELRHDGFRDPKDWPTLLRNYGAGDGAFYTKHARCRDPYAWYLLLRVLVLGTAKVVVKKLIRRPGGEWAYMRGFFLGIKDSFKFKVNRQARLYVPAPAAPGKA